jgi:hypothetical protein
MRRLLLLAALAFAVTASPAHAILDGEPDGNAHPYVVAVRSPTGGVCTGSVISAHRVLTAAHCMPPGATAKVVFGPNARTSTDFVFGTFNRHPGWCPGCSGGVPGIDTNDVAVIVVPGNIAPPYATLPALGFVDTLGQKQAVTSVGYGIRTRPKDFAGQILERYRVTSELVDSNHVISDEYLRLSASKGGTCGGDSGGPSLVGDTIVGITAFAVNSNCAGVTYAQRIDIAQTRNFIVGPLP